MSDDKVENLFFTITSSARNKDFDDKNIAEHYMVNDYATLTGIMQAVPLFRMSFNPRAELFDI